MMMVKYAYLQSSTELDLLIFIITIKYRYLYTILIANPKTTIMPLINR